ncbi:hypothetical protein CEP54_011919 [Fusarium duplospermum]|uniref:Uncharacterized protein n=1 Tax=Fusarium duplospermum TaxID=1325734 RepID=A0A428PBR8_9HYPO|nr:hypothetical protein CEP54_011919 [Fusarium duplospermum]
MSAPPSITTSRICHPAKSLCLCSNPPTRSTSPLANGTPSECSRCKKRPQSPARPRTVAGQPLAANHLSHMGGGSTLTTGGPEIDLAAMDTGNLAPIQQRPPIPDVPQ